jgi:hypothetical protein
MKCLAVGFNCSGMSLQISLITLMTSSLIETV